MSDMIDIFDRIAAIARVDAEIIRRRWEAMSPEERRARERCEIEQLKSLGSSVEMYRSKKGRA